MSETIIVEGKTTAEAIEKGLKQLKTTKNNVLIKTIEEDKKRSFYSILAPRTVKIEMTLKEESVNNTKIEKKPKKTLNKDLNDIEKTRKILEKFFKDILGTEYVCETKIENYCIYIQINGENINNLIGYRGSTINALQTLALAVANKNSKMKTAVIVDVGDYKEKRKKTLEELAEKVAQRVLKTRKSVMLEPMTAYERKIIHTKLQENEEIETYSKGEEPHRRIVITIKNKA